jgi:serine/threonine protein kinase
VKSSERWQEIERFFDAAVELPVAERTRYLDAECADARVRAEVSKLLQASDRAGDFLDQPALEAASPLFRARLPAASTVREDLQAALAETYTIERELEGASMARVYVAIEKPLGRRVVIKYFSPDAAAGLSTKRFAREIRLAASLQQANIVPLLSSGVVNGLPYYTMPFVEGRSLRDRIATEGKLGVPQVIAILRDVARALAYAHDHGIVHRDIKPENVLLSGDAAVVTDFGIAKALSDARGGRRTSDATTTMTAAGTALGTPAYMAPEQLGGEEGIDHRVDLYAFGCLAYELLTGATPFGERTLKQLVAAHLFERPVALATIRGDCPEHLAYLVMQCLEKVPVNRPRTAREILVRLDDATAGGPVLPRRSPRAGLTNAARAALAAFVRWIRRQE